MNSSDEYYAAIEKAKQTAHKKGMAVIGSKRIGCIFASYTFIDKKTGRGLCIINHGKNGQIHKFLERIESFKVYSVLVYVFVSECKTKTDNVCFNPERTEYIRFAGEVSQFGEMLEEL